MRTPSEAVQKWISCRGGAGQPAALRAFGSPARHRADEADALARDGADQPLLVAAVADRLARGVDAAGQRRVRHDAAAPDRRRSDRPC